MQMNYPAAFPAERTIVLPPPPRAARTRTPTRPAGSAPASAHCWPGLEPKALRDQIWETTAWLALALSALVALAVCLDI